VNQKSGKMKKLIIFGAGKIGRSFIGQLFSRAGFEVVFVDIAQKMIDELNRKLEYRVQIRSDEESMEWVIRNVRGLLYEQTDEVSYEIANADFLAISVGQKGMAATCPLIAAGLKARRHQFPDRPLDLIIAENMRNADQFMKTELMRYLPDEYPIDQLVGLVETSIGKMVPFMSPEDEKEDILLVYAEPYNTLIVDGMAFKNQVPQIKGLAPKNNIKAWVDRKAFIHNLGHSAAAYFGFLSHPDATFIWDVLEDPEVFNKTRLTMMQSAEALLAEYPNEFTLELLTDHVDDLLHRFRNKALGDTLFRVGCDLYRKLGREDRLAGAIRLVRKHNLPSSGIREALEAGYYFRAKDLQGRLFVTDQQFDEEMKLLGQKKMMTKVSGIS
jgi:mannitol-1-phosphate 5-dehydrogenase